MIFYKNYPVFPYSIKPLNYAKRDIAHRRKFIGKKWQNEYYYYIEREKYSVSLNFNFENYEEMTQIKDFVFDRQGRAKLFWMPTWNNDLVPIKKVNNLDTKIVIKQSFFDIYKTTKRPLIIYIPTIDFISYVINVEENYDDTLDKVVDTISIADAIPDNLEPETCPPIQFLFLGRFSSDTVSFKFIDLFRGECGVNFSELSIYDYKRYIPEVVVL